MLFKPKYAITDKILNNLTLIASGREIIEQAYLVPKWEAKLRRQALLHNTHSSTAMIRRGLEPRKGVTRQAKPLLACDAHGIVVSTANSRIRLG